MTRLLLKMQSINLKHSLLLLGVLFSSCSNRITGIYSWSGDLIAHKVEICPDSTFIYTVYACLGTSETKGTWTMKDHLLYLKSFSSYRPFQIEEETAAISNIAIEILNDPYSNVIPTDVLLNGDSTRKYSSDSSGHISIEGKDTFQSLLVKSINHRLLYKRKSAASNHFLITCAEDYNTWYLEDTLLMHRNKLLTLDKYRIFKRHSLTPVVKRDTVEASQNW